MSRLQSLYLDACKVKQVSLESFSLKIQHPKHAVRYFPLSRLSRVIVLGSINWDSAAINACMKQGITLIFSNSQGEIRGICQSINQEQSSFSQLFQELMSTLDGHSDLMQWTRAIERQYQIKSFQKLGIELDSYHEKTLFQIMDLWSQKNTYLEQVTVFFEILQTLLYAQASDFLVQLFKLYSKNEHLNLNQHLSYCLSLSIRWLLFTMLLKHCCKQPNQKLDKKTVIHFFQKQHGVIENEFFHLINKLYQWLLTREDYNG